MNTNITKEQAIFNAFNEAMSKAGRDGLVPFGRIRRTVSHFNGVGFDEEEIVLPNIVTKNGLNAIAELMLGDATGTNSGFKYLVIGTAPAAGPGPGRGRAG